MHRRFAEAIGADPALVMPGALVQAAVEQALALACGARRSSGPGRRLAGGQVSGPPWRWHTRSSLRCCPGSWSCGSRFRTRLSVSALITPGCSKSRCGPLIWLCGHRAITLARGLLEEIDAAAEPVRAALLLRMRGHLKYHLGHGRLRR